MSPRVKLVLLAGLFALPMAASFVAYHYARPEPTGNYGELLLPPTDITGHPFTRPEGTRFAFAELAGKWILVTSDSGGCPTPCVEKLVAMRQVRLALGRNAPRLDRVLVVDDARSPDPGLVREFPGMVLALSPSGAQIPPGAANDRAHIYLVDPKGNVMMRWPAGADRKRMLADLQRLLKASQIG